MVPSVKDLITFIWTRTTLSLMTFWRCLLSKIWSCGYGPFVINLNDSLTMLSIRLDHLHRILLQSLIGMILWRCLVNKMKYEVYIDAINHNTWLFRQYFMHLQAQYCILIGGEARNPRTVLFWWEFPMLFDWLMPNFPIFLEHSQNAIMSLTYRCKFISAIFFAQKNFIFHHRATASPGREHLGR